MKQTSVVLPAMYSRYHEYVECNTPVLSSLETLNIACSCLCVFEHKIHNEVCCFYTFCITYLVPNVEIAFEII